MIGNKMLAILGRSLIVFILVTAGSCATMPGNIGTT